ncbi:glycosyltransferase [Okeania sp.]|uniref:glycosyltransferase n=1 Tax=Okeania sp. TaxID=3100323 RepID=UPI002B4B1A62|nr:glycosyltransferase [Okeania sp.]MEB3340288.1 glycosyltransferase [Okeania sp.]
MKNILFVLYEDFHSNSALHVHHFANNLVELGLDCAVAVPRNKHTVSLVGENLTNLYQVTEYGEFYRLNECFKNQKGPDVVHVWTPREVTRNYCRKLRKAYDFQLVIHLEDNEEYVLEKYLNKPFSEIANANGSLNIPENVSHPQRYKEFLATANGVTVIIEKLKEFVPNNVPTLTLWPGVDTEHFSQRKPNPERAKQLGVPDDNIVFSYTGNVHAANTEEVKSLYLAVALLNREGQRTTLIRTGRDFENFLGDDDSWARQYAIELGYVDRSLMPEILALANVLVQPGKPDKFNDYRFPCKLPEFLAMGKPVVLPATNIGLEMENEKDALVLPAVDATHIVDSVTKLLQDKSLYKKLSDGSINFAKTHLSWQKNTKLLLSFYKEI